MFRITTISQDGPHLLWVGLNALVEPHPQACRHASIVCCVYSCLYSHCTHTHTHPHTPTYTITHPHTQLHTHTHNHTPTHTHACRLYHLPYSLTELKHLTAIWIAENQSRPIIELQLEVDKQGEKWLTCFLLPQQGHEPPYDQGR